MHLFTDDIVLIDETRNLISSKLEAWTEALEQNRFKISKSKIEYMRYKYSKTTKEE